MAINVGSIEVSVVPDLRGFPELLASKVVPAADLAGKQAADAISGPINRELDKVQARLAALSGESAEVHVDADTAAAMAEFAAVQAEVDHLDGRNVDIDVDDHGSIAKIDRGFSGLISSALALGPALVPIGATAVPLLSGMATGALAAGAGVGVLALAFGGIPSLLKLMSTAQDGTTASQKKLDAALAQTSTTTQQFASRIFALQPVFEKLQNTARENLFPGLTSGLNALMPILPSFNTFIGTIASTLGRLFDAGAHALTAPFWTRFFDYVQATAGPSLEMLGKTLGNTAKGFAGLLQAFAPVSQQLGEGLLRLTQRFADFGQAATFGSIRPFLDYLQRTGPQVADTLGAVVQAFGRLLEALAPIGGVSLQIIKSFADAINKIPVPVLTALVGGFIAVNTAMRGLSIGSKLIDGISSAIGGLKGARGVLAGVGDAIAAISVNASLAGGGVKGIVTAIGGAIGPFGAAGLAVGALAVGLGALYIHQKNAEVAQRKLTAAQIDAVAVNLQQVTTVDEMNARYEASIRTMMNQVTSTAAVSNSVRDLAKNSDGLAQIYAEQVAKQVENIKGQKQWQEALQKSKTANAEINGVINNVTSSMGANKDSVLGLIIQNGLLEVRTDTLIGKYAGLNVSADQATAILQANLRTMQQAQDPAFQLSQRQQTLADTFASSADKVKAFREQLDNLTKPALDAQAADDALTQSVLDMTKAVTEHTITLDANTAAGLQGREMVRSRISAILDDAAANYANGVSITDLETKYQSQRESLIQTVMQLGKTRDEAINYINTLHLTPDKINTLFTADQWQAMLNTRSYHGDLNAIPANILTQMHVDTGDAEYNLSILAAKINSIPREVWVNVGVGGTMGVNAAIGALMNPPGRAEGGPVRAGELYMVGERGPEPFIPATDGYILPHSSLTVAPPAAAGDRNVTLNFNAPIYGVDDLEATISAALDKHDRNAAQARKAYLS